MDLVYKWVVQCLVPIVTTVFTGPLKGAGPDIQR